MSSPGQDMREVSELSPDPRVRIFRRVLRGFAQFEGLTVDAYVVIGTSHVVILDTLLCPADMEYVLATIQPELAQKRLLCVNSHADWDHVWGNSSLAARHAVPILAHEECYQRLLSPEARQTLDDYKQHTRAFDEVVITPPTLTFRTDLRIADESLPIELFHAPGHCRDHIAAWLPSLRLLLAFDAVEMPLPCIEESSQTPMMFATLERLAALPARAMLCSHGNTCSPELVQENRAYFQQIAQRSRALLEQRTPGAEELNLATTLINYPLDEVLARYPGVEIDRTYYAWAHEQNIQAVLRWLMQ